MKDLTARLKDFYAGLAERDQRALVVGVVASVLIIVVAGLSSLIIESRSASSRVIDKRALLAQLPEIRDREQRLQTLGSDLAMPLEALANRITARHGIEAALDRQGDSVIRLRANNVPFDAVLECLADLETASVITRRAVLTATGAGRVDLELDIQKPAP
jgi:type II secretory pathway component PulM